MNSYKQDHLLGLDIGGTSIKGAVVDLRSGEFTSERISLPTPQPARPAAVRKVVGEMLELQNWTGPVGCGFPTMLKDGVALTANNISDSWKGKYIARYFAKEFKQAFHVINDADAAGYAELQYGVAKSRTGRLLLLTIGTGIGSAFIEEGRLLQGIELGSMHWDGKRNIEQYAANSARKKENLEWKEWAKRFSKVLHYIHSIVGPDLFILGGGLSNKAEFYEQWLPDDLPWTLAEMRNNAGIVGAAVYAGRRLGAILGE